jgi:hypothetical protein
MYTVKFNSSFSDSPYMFRHNHHQIFYIILSYCVKFLYNLSNKINLHTNLLYKPLFNISYYLLHDSKANGYEQVIYKIS